MARASFGRLRAPGPERLLDEARLARTKGTGLNILNLRHKAIEILEKQLRFPGRAEGGTGPTGIAPGDKDAYLLLLEERRALPALEKYAQLYTPPQRKTAAALYPDYRPR